MFKGWQPIYELGVNGFGGKTGAVAIRGTYMGTGVNEMHTGGQKGSVGESLFETSPGRPGLLMAGGVVQPHEAGG